MKLNGAVISLLASTALAAQPNPPTWPSSFSVFTPATPADEILAKVSDAYAENGGSPNDGFCNNGQFSDSRFGFFFAPGSYDTDVPVGFYTSVYGGGVSPEDTVFTGARGVYAEQGCADFQVGALDTFWRSAENFHTTSSYPWEVGTGMTWAVSQAAPLRNVKVDNDLLFFQYIPASCCAAGFASGGYGSGLSVGGDVAFGSQQQFFVRNSEAASFSDTVWNGVFSGVSNAPASSPGSANTTSTTVVEETPLIAEKPYITSDATASKFTLQVPPVVANAAGINEPSGNVEVDFENVYVSDPDTDTADTLNDALSAGLHLVISPGIYTLSAPLVVEKENQVLLGLGLATLICPPSGNACIQVADVSGARVAGVLLQAGKYSTAAMLQVGTPGGGFKGDPENPAVLTDVFARVGGPDTGVGPVGSMVSVDMGNVIIDNTWLWRADHTDGGGGDDALVKGGDNACKNGLVVNGDSVFAYGLAAEHTTESNVVWNGDDGTVFFYQAEIMYDWTDGDWPHSCYELGEGVTGHEARGVGCYSYFRDSAGASCETGFDSKGGVTEGRVVFENAVSVYLNGEGGGIRNVVDSDGLAVDADVAVARD